MTDEAEDIRRVLAICFRGETELDAVIEEIKGDEGVDWMMHS